MGMVRDRKRYLCVRYTMIHQYRGGSHIGRWVVNTETPVCECERGAWGSGRCGLASAVYNYTLQPPAPAGQTTTVVSLVSMMCMLDVRPPKSCLVCMSAGCSLLAERRDGPPCRQTFQDLSFRCITQMLNSFVLLTKISFMYSVIGPALLGESTWPHVL
jgi:hypothetical protein